MPYAVEAERSSTDAQAERAAALTSTVVRQETSSCSLEPGSAMATDCVCRADEVAISGGACAGLFSLDPPGRLSVSERVDSRTWRVGCQNGSGSTVPCVNPFVVCLRVAD